MVVNHPKLLIVLNNFNANYVFHVIKTNVFPLFCTEHSRSLDL